MERGRVIGEKYELIAPIGEGGMGVVWRAKHVTLGREVALKRVIGGEQAGETTLQRFLREAQSAAAVRAPNVVDVVDYGRDAAGDPYLVMELLDGESLEQRLRREPPLSLEATLDLLDQALAGLAAIHDAGIVHRDLKPANLFLSRADDGRIVVKVLDFGVARPAAPEASALTHTMQTLGTPHYMSPEQVRSAKTVDARSDVYAMGVILYQVVTGRLPFEGPSATAIIAAIVTEDPPTIRSLRPEVPALVAEVIQRAMSRRADERFADARALREALRRARAGETLPELAAGRVSVNAPTAVMSTPDPSTGGRSADRERAAPKKATGRRGFFALFGVLSTAGVVGLALLTVMQRGASPEMAASAEPASAGPAGAGPASAGSARGVGAAGVGEREGGGGAPGGTPQPLAPPVPAADPIALEPAIPMLVGAPRPLAEVALAWRTLPPADRTGLVARPLEGGWVLATASPGHAQRIAGLLSTLARPEETPAPATAILTPRLFRTNARSNVRRGPAQENALLGTVADDAVLVGMLGTIEDQRSGAEETEGWVRVFASSALDGWTARRLLDDETRCMPAAELVQPTEVLSRLTVHEAGREYDAFLAIDARTARLYETDAVCNLMERHLVRTGGVIGDAFVTEVANRGESVLVLGEWPHGRITADGRQSWSARLVSDLDEVVWHEVLASGQNLPDARRDGLGGPFSRGPDGAEGFFPLRIRHPRERVWLVWSAERRTFERIGQDREATPLTTEE